jgi:phospholipid/cholesterol/gamma-HCH transport system permease protein
VIKKVGTITITVLEELSSLVWFVVNTSEEMMVRIRRKRFPFRLSNFFEQADRVGPQSIPLVCMVSVFLGFTMALLTGYQLQRFGSENLVPGLITISFTRELAPLLTGIVLAARIGAAFTAELGTMTVSEEVEAIEGMGIGSLRYLAAPRILSVFLFFPCLSVASDVSAILGASFIAQTLLHMSYSYFFDEVMNNLLIRDINAGIIKSFLFGFLVSVIACYRGLTVRGGAARVGTSTTSSVVTAITTVLGCDTLCNLALVMVFEK